MFRTRRNRSIFTIGEILCVVGVMRGKLRTETLAQPFLRGAFPPLFLISRCRQGKNTILPPLPPPRLSLHQYRRSSLFIFSAISSWPSSRRLPIPITESRCPPFVHVRHSSTGWHARGKDYRIEKNKQHSLFYLASWRTRQEKSFRPSNEIPSFETVEEISCTLIHSVVTRSICDKRCSLSFSAFSIFFFFSLVYRYRQSGKTNDFLLGSPRRNIVIVLSKTKLWSSIKFLRLWR